MDHSIIALRWGEVKWSATVCDRGRGVTSKRM